MELIKVLGLDIKILIAQFINFAIFFFVLYKFAYKPILKFLDDRKIKIENGVENAEKAQKKLLEIEEREKSIIENAKTEAKKISKEIIDGATTLGEDKKNQIIEKTKQEIKILIEQEKKSLKAQKFQVIKEIKEDVSSLIISSLEKILNEKLPQKDIEKVIKEISQK